MRDRAKQREYKRKRYQQLKDDERFKAMNRDRVNRYHKTDKWEKLYNSEKYKENRRKLWSETYFIKVSHNGYQYWYKGNKRLHRLIYERYIGKIPKGFDIHHKNHDTLNNSLGNLMLIKHSEHTRLHKLGEI